MTACTCPMMAPEERPCPACSSAPPKITDGLTVTVSNVRTLDEVQSEINARVAPPAFEVVSATLWVVVVAFQPGPELPSVNTGFHVMTADPSGAEVFAIARAHVLAKEPKASDIVIVRMERHGEVDGTVVRKRGSA